MQDVRQDWYEDQRTLSESREADLGDKLLVSCEARGCDHIVLMDPRPLFGSRRFWPVSGRSERFRCRCGSRETTLSYTLNTAAHDTAMSKDVIRLWT